MATKLARMITYHGGLQPINSLGLLITWQTKNIISPIPQCPWPPNLVRLWLTLRGSYGCYSHKNVGGLAWLRDKLKTYITTTITIVTTLVKMVIYHEELPLIKLLPPSTWLCKVMWHAKYFAFPLALDQWPSNLARWWLTVMGFQPQILITLNMCSREVM